MGIRMTQFDTELEEKARQNAQNMLQTAIAPSGPAAGTPASPTKDKAASPVTINIAGTGGNDPSWLQRQAGEIGAVGKNLGLAAQMPAAALNWANQNVIPPMTGGYKFGSDFNVAGVPGGTPGNIYSRMVENLYPWVKPKEFSIPGMFGMVPTPGRETPTAAIPSPGQVPSLAPGHTPGVSRAQEIIDMAKNAGGGYEAAPSAPDVGWFQVEGGPRQMITDDYWKTPVPGKGSFSVIPGSAAGQMMTENIGGRQVTLPASAWADILNREAEARTYDNVRMPDGGISRVARRDLNAAPEWTIPPEHEKQMTDLLKVIQSPDVSPQQKATAVQVFGDLNRMVAEQNHYRGEMWTKQMGIPLEERRTKAAEMGAYANAKTAESQLMLAGPHADYFRKMANEGQLVPPGYAIFNPETRKAMFENPQKSEAFAPLARDALLASTEDTPAGKVVNPFAFMGYMNLMGRTVSKERGTPWEDITVKNMNREMVAPYIHRIIQTNPKTGKLKPDSKEYQQLYSDTLRELYK